MEGERAVSDLVSFDSLMKDLHPLPGTRIKQWVVDERREHAWERQTCPHVDIPGHDDNTDILCRNSGGAPWARLDHDCCSLCGDTMEATAGREDIASWRAERDARPPVCADRSLLSDQIEPEWKLEPHPVFKMLRR